MHLCICADVIPTPALFLCGCVHGVLIPTGEELPPSLPRHGATHGSLPCQRYARSCGSAQVAKVSGIGIDIGIDIGIGIGIDTGIGIGIGIDIGIDIGIALGLALSLGLA